MATLRASKLFLIAWSSVLPQILVNGQCYYPNGDPSLENDQPCSPNGDGPCCPLNWTCLSNGLCKLEANNYLGRYTCTDKSWQSSSCPNICTHDNTASGNEAVLECSTGEYCCDANRPEISVPPGPKCCDTTNDYFSLPDLGSNSPSATTSTSDTASIETSSTDTTSSETSNTDTTVEPSSTDIPTSNNSGDSSELETTSEGLSTQDAPSSTPTTKSQISESNTLPPLTSVISTSTPSTTGNTHTGLSPSAITSIVILTSVIVNSAGSSTSIITSKTVEQQSSNGSSPSVIAQTALPNNLGMKIGVGVGVPVGVLALALLGFLLWRYKRKHLSLPPLVDNTPSDGALDPEYMYKGNADLGTPATATTVSPDLNKRASSKYVVGDAEEGTYRGVHTGGFGLHPGSAERSNLAIMQSELSGNPPLPRGARNVQMSELDGSRYHPSELPEHPYR